MSTNTLKIPLVEPSHPAGAAAPPRCAGKVVIQTHGCKLNQADSSALARQFRQAGYLVVEEVREADIYVLNTCTVTATADAKARQSLRAARRANPEALVVAAGCYPQRAAEELAQMPAVSLVVGNEDKGRLASLAIAAHRERAGSPATAIAPVAVGPAAIDPAVAEPASVSITGNLPGRSRGMVKIQEGCDQVCAYCIVPRVRGRERSIPPEEIIRQIRQRVSEGCREVTLTGTQLGSYGFDLPGTDLKTLLQRALAETNLERLRVSSLQPQEIGGDLLQLWLDDSRLCPHFHLPLQSGSDPVLKAMRRRYTTGQFAETVRAIRAAIPDAGITADLIVGFPGEGDREFEDSLAFAAAMQFSDLHVFPYSRRPGTSAVYLPNQVAESPKKERMGRALAMARQSFERFRLAQLGTTHPVLWEGRRPAGDRKRQLGLTDNYIRVAMDCGDGAAEGQDWSNTITGALLVELSGKTVLARPVPAD